MDYMFIFLCYSLLLVDLFFILIFHLHSIHVTIVTVIISISVIIVYLTLYICLNICVYHFRIIAVKYIYLYMLTAVSWKKYLTFWWYNFFFQQLFVCQGYILGKSLFDYSTQSFSPIALSHTLLLRIKLRKISNLLQVHQKSIEE